MKFPCPHCHQSLEAREEHQGMKADCGLCGGAFTVPVASANPTRVAGMDPAELLARGLNTVNPPDADTWEAPTPEELSRLLPQYRIDSIIGRGGMGAVYKGDQERLGRHVAIKLLPSELAEDPNFVARFEREARTLAKLDHPGIIHVHDFGQTSEGHLYFVMEFVDGTDLHHLIHGPGINPAQALEIIGQVCDALQFAHTKGVVHRDIKPANILVTSDGRVKLADFGLARPLRTGISGQLTLTRVIMGTPDYMAPEQKRGEGDHRVDLYALGVMLYEMLCGRTPQGAWQPPSQRVQVDVRLDQVVIKAMQEEPERRYQQASQVKTDLDAISSSLSKKARTAPVKSPVPPAKPNAPGASPASPKSFPKKPLTVAAVCLLPVIGFGAWFASHDRSNSRSAQAAIFDPASPAATGQVTTPANATKEAPFVNSFGMKFVPVPGTKVLFSIWETRVKDYTAYARENKVDGAWMQMKMDKVPVSREPEHPVCGVNLADAKGFCEWLTKKEKAAGKLPVGAAYRLPTDEEWSRAVGLQSDVGTSPEEKSANNDVDYPWGLGFPPKVNAGNYADELFRGEFPNRNDKPSIKGYVDGFATTAPVGSFEPNQFGIYDLGGNVAEWCGDLYQPGGLDGVLRGGAWDDGMPKELRSSMREPGNVVNRYPHRGIRCVLVPDGVSSTAGTQAQPPASSSTTNSSNDPVIARIEEALVDWRKLPEWNRYKNGQRISRNANGRHNLVLDDLAVRDANPLGGLREIPLERIEWGRPQPPSDLKPFADLDLIALKLPYGGTPYPDLHALKGAKLRSVTGCFQSLDGADELKLTDLCVYCSGIQDLEPLCGGRNLDRMYLVNLWNLRDLTPLSTHPLINLHIETTPVENLDPLKDCPLQRLGLHNLKQLQSISVLRGKSLISFGLQGCPLVTDLTPLLGSPKLETLYVDGYPTHLETLRGMKIQTINDKPAAEYWAEWDKAKK
jgi:serine/threonine protein kinase